MRQENFGPTVYGIEQEYTVTATVGSEGISHEIVGACHSPDSKLGLFKKPESGSLDDISIDQYSGALKSLGIYRNRAGMLSNGGRFYIDPSGPEYCTPETTTASEAVLRTFDGDKIMFGVLRFLQSRDAIKSFQLNRRVVDHNGSSRGVHLNTSTMYGYEPSLQIVDALCALNVAKGALFGSGGLIINGKGNTEYHHSPRLSITNQSGIVPASYTDRTLVRHPFKYDVDCSRVETITSDALNFAWPLRASMVMTNALLKLTELDEYKGKLTRLASPITAARQVGQHGNSAVIEIIDKFDNKRVYPSEVLIRIATMALEANQSFGQLDAESLQVLDEVIETAEIIRADSTQVMQRIESVARYEFMKRKIEEHGVDWDSKKLCQYDYYWDKIGGGVAEKLRETKGWGWHGFNPPDTPAKATKRLAVPPKGTRAELRGKLIHKSKGSNRSKWYDFDLEEVPGNFIDFHPLRTEL